MQVIRIRHKFPQIGLDSFSRLRVSIGSPWLSTVLALNLLLRFSQAGSDSDTEWRSFEGSFDNESFAFRY